MEVQHFRFFSKTIANPCSLRQIKAKLRKLNKKVMCPGLLQWKTIYYEQPWLRVLTLAIVIQSSVFVKVNLKAKAHSFNFGTSIYWAIDTSTKSRCTLAWGQVKTICSIYYFVENSLVSISRFDPTTFWHWVSFWSWEFTLHYDCSWPNSDGFLVSRSTYWGIPYIPR